jgi:hypothetical protein
MYLIFNFVIKLIICTGMLVGALCDLDMVTE